MSLINKKTYIRENKFVVFLKSRIFILIAINTLIFITLSALKPSVFLDWYNQKAIFSLMTYDLLLACGMTLILIIRGIDLSVGSIVALSSVVMALLMRAEVPVWPSLLLGFIAAMACGAFNGLLITRLDIAPFLVTLATMSIARGIATVCTWGQYISFPNVNELFVTFGRDELIIAKTENAQYGIPMILIITMGILLLFGILLKYWKPLNQAFYVGENREAARLSGIRVNRVIMAGYVISAFLCFIAALFMNANMRIGYANYGLGSEMRAIAAAVVGGASMMGGRGSLIGTFLGVLMLAFIGNGFVLLNGSPNWQQATIGIVLILAVAFDVLTNRHQGTK